MRCVTNRDNPHPSQTLERPRLRWLPLLFLVGLALSSVACAGERIAPTPTAIPLAATVTAPPQPTRSAPTALAARPSPTTRPATATSSREPAGTLSELDDVLARRTAEDLLRRLVRGETQTVAKLYLTDRAHQAGVDHLLADLAAGERPLAEATILEFRRATATSYEARALLRWSGGDDRPPATQTLTLRLGYERGLWLADTISLGDLRAPTPTPTRRPAARSSRPDPQLSGRLVFQVSSGGEIYTIQADGTNLRRLTDGLDPAWAPDGSRIAFTRWRYPWGIYLIQPDGSGEERVVDGPQLKEVAWAPDGARIAFTLNRGSSEPTELCFFGYCFTIPAFSLGQVWVADLAHDKYLSLPLDDRAVHAPAWRPDGNRIVYAGERGLTWLDLDSMETGHFPGGSVWDTSPTYSPDGQQIAFMGRVHSRWEVMIMNADGSGRRQLTHSDPDLAEPPSNVAPAWSPDGKQIAFLSNRAGPWRIYVMNADGSGQHPMFGDALDPLGFRYEWASERVISWTD